MYFFGNQSYFSFKTIKILQFNVRASVIERTTNFINLQQFSSCGSQRSQTFMSSSKLSQTVGLRKISSAQSGIAARFLKIPPDLIAIAVEKINISMCHANFSILLVRNLCIQNNYRIIYQLSGVPLMCMI